MKRCTIIIIIITILVERTNSSKLELEALRDFHHRGNKIFWPYYTSVEFRREAIISFKLFDVNVFHFYIV